LQPVLEALHHPDLKLIYTGELGIANQHAFRAPQKLPVRNLYICIKGSAALRNHLAVSNLLRRDEWLKREYGALKSELAVEITRNAGMVKRKHAELADLVREDREDSEDIQLMGRLGVSILEDVDTITAGGSLRRVLDAMPLETKRVGHISLLSAFFDSRRADAITIAKNVLDAFISALAQTAQKNNSTATTADTDSETCVASA
jgi:hypothetical protein